MALNPPIMAVPPQEADRGAHIQRFLSSLPRPGPSGDIGGHDLVEERGCARTDQDEKTAHVSEPSAARESPVATYRDDDVDGLDAEEAGPIQDQEAERRQQHAVN